MEVKSASSPSVYQCGFNTSCHRLNGFTLDFKFGCFVTNDPAHPPVDWTDIDRILLHIYPASPGWGERLRDLQPQARRVCTGRAARRHRGALRPMRIGSDAAWSTALTTASAIIMAAAGPAAIPSSAAPVVRASTITATDSPAMDACLKGEQPDVTETAFLSGTNGRASYPRGVQPDNAIFPGDVVRIEITGRLRYNAKEWTGPGGTVC